MSSDFTPGDNKPFIQTQIKSTQRLRYSFATQIGTIHRRPNSTPLDSMAEQARHRQEQAPELNQKRRPLPASSLATNNSGVSEDRKRLIDWPLRISPTGCRAEALFTSCCPSCSKRRPWSRSGPLPTSTTHWKHPAENALRKVRWHRTRPKPKRESRTI